MNPRTLTVRSEWDGPVLVCRLGGDIDAAAEAALAEVRDTAAGATDIELDFTDVEYINSTGIALIVGLLSQARVAGQEVSAVGLSPHYRHIFEITRLADFMAMRDHPRSGVASATAG